MSMTVYISTGVTDLDLLLEALGQMGKSAFATKGDKMKIRGQPVLAVAFFDGKKVGFCRNKSDELVMVADSEWRCAKDKKLRESILQQYSVAAVKRKIKELRYHVASVDTLTDGAS